MCISSIILKSSCLLINQLYIYIRIKTITIMNPVLKIAIELSEGNQILLNRNEKLTPEFLEYTKGEGNLFNSLYFSKNGIEYRISNHELPNRLFMEKHNFRNIDHAIEMGYSKNLFHKNNIELIVVNGQIVKNNLNFNF